MRLRLRPLVLAALLAATPALHAQDSALTVDVAAGSHQTFSIAGPARLTYDLTARKVVIVWGPPSPTPTPPPVDPPIPQPPPTPTPAPQPIATGKLFVTLIYSEKAETQPQAQARAGLALSKEWAGLDADFDAYEVGQKAVDDRKMRKYVTTVPCVLVQERKAPGAIAPWIKTIDGEFDAASVLAAVKALRGNP